MSHPQQLGFLKQVISILPNDVSVRILDLGSLDINGGIRPFLPRNFEYLGVDLEIGPNVDLACEAQLLDLKSEQFDLVISSELFEHTPFWKEIFAQMCRLTKPGGIVAFTCAGVGRPEHGTTRSDKGFSSPFTVSKGDEYYGNVPRSEASRAIALKSWFTAYSFFDEYSSKDLYFVGLRAQGELVQQVEFNKLLKVLQAKYPVKWYKLRYWSLKFLPFPITDVYLRISHKYSYLVKHFIYNLYVDSGLRNKRHASKL